MVNFDEMLIPNFRKRLDVITLVLCYFHQVVDVRADVPRRGIVPGRCHCLSLNQHNNKQTYTSHCLSHVNSMRKAMSSRVLSYNYHELTGHCQVRSRCYLLETLCSQYKLTECFTSTDNKFKM